jgi:hypothetical protein
MEARAELRQPRISKGLVAIVALSVTLGLGVMAGTVAKNANGSSATTSSQTHAIVYGKGGPAFGSVRHGGAQTVEENAAPTVIRGVSPDAQDRKAAQKLVPDAADSKNWVSAPKWFTPMPSSTAAPIYYLPDGLGYRER